ncbi:E3 ubiquitin-protein ligase RMA1-like isoform 1 [Balamuthia mandrillaris]
MKKTREGGSSTVSKEGHPEGPPPPPPPSPHDNLKFRVENLLDQEDGQLREELHSLRRSFATSSAPSSTSDSSSSSSATSTSTLDFSVLDPEHGFADLPSLEKLCHDSVFGRSSSREGRSSSSSRETGRTERKHRFFRALRRDMVVKGIVESIREFGLLVTVQEVFHLEDRRGPVLIPPTEADLLAIDDIHITALCHITELSDDRATEPKDERDLRRWYTVGSPIQALVVSCDPSTERVKLSTKLSRCPTFVTDASFLGPCKSSAKRRADRRDMSPPLQEPAISTFSYNKALCKDVSFWNPCSLNAMAEAFGIWQLGSLVDNPEFPEDAYYEKIRAWQNYEWAKETVSQGLVHAKKGDYTTAMRFYNQALEVDPKHRDAFVARGAVYVNQRNYEAAVKEFETAVQIGPPDKNTLKYLAAAKQKLEELKTKEEATREREASEQEALDKERVNAKLRYLLEKEERKRKKRKRKRKEKEREKQERSRSRDKKRRVTDSKHGSRKKSSSSSNKGRKKHKSTKRSSSSSSSSHSASGSSPSSGHGTGTATPSLSASPSPSRSPSPSTARKKRDRSND